jgi:hypothetical protein
MRHDKAAAMAMLKGRATSIKDACAHYKIDPDPITAAALIYNAMRIMKLPAEIILDGPVVLGIQAVLSEIALKADAMHQYDPSDPDAPVTLTNAQLMTLINSKLGDA